MVTGLKIVVASAVCLLLASAALPANWSFSIDLDSAYAQDADIRRNTATTNYGAAATAPIGYNSGDTLFPWIAVPCLGDTLASGGGGGGYSGTVDSAYFTIRLSGDRFDAADDSLILLCYPLRRSPVESQITWNIYKTDSSWTTAGAESSTSDYYDFPGDTCFLIGNLADNDTFHLDLNPSYVGASHEHWIARMVRRYGTDYTLFSTTDDVAQDETPVLHVFGHTTAGGSAAPCRRRRLL